MLTHIYIRDFTLIHELSLELRSGMTALTGETGAGKSILIDALGLALGDRADAGVIRTDADGTDISLSFDLSACLAASEWLEAQGLTGQDCVLRRTLSREGRSKGFINGRPVPMTSLQELGELLVDIHGQHQHQSLTKRDIQRQLLDDYAGCTELAQQVRKVYENTRTLTETWERLSHASTESTTRAELLRFQIQELEQLGLAEAELDQLNQEHDKLANAGQLMDSCRLALERLDESESQPIIPQLNQVEHALAPLAAIDKDLANAYRLVQGALIESNEAAAEIRAYLDKLDLDPERLLWVNNRLSEIHELARKHRIPVHELAGLLDRLRQELDSLDSSDERLAALKKQLDELTASYQQQAQQLTQARKTAAVELDKQVTRAIHELGMPHAVFTLVLIPNDAGKLAAHGNESIEYRITTNPGQEPKSLTKIASGGELSRISLAIQVVLAQNTRIGTLVYDEVDTGIGGPTAEIVGRLLRRLGSTRQVLCVTHLPQVAAQAHQHLQVHKHTQAQKVVTGIQTLDEHARVEEIARMLGGLKMTAQSRAHAVEMLKSSRD